MKAARGDVFVKRAENTHLGRRQPDLLLCLAKRRMAGGSVGRIDTAARKRDLAGMIAQMAGTARQHDMQPARPLAQPAEYGRMAMRALIRGIPHDMGVEVEI